MGEGGLEYMMWEGVAYIAWCWGENGLHYMVEGGLHCMVWGGWLTLRGVGGGGLDCMVWGRVA